VDDVKGVNMSNVENIDRLAARCAQELADKGDAKTVGNLLTKALGVLQEQGVYACLLFLKSQGADKTVEELRKLLGGLPVTQPSKSEEFLKFIAERLSARLDELLLVRDVYEQALIYGRYAAKVRSREAGS
jgi:hypothetical protein